MREPQAIFFTLFFPVLLLVVMSFISSSNYGNFQVIQVGFVDNLNTPLSSELRDTTYKVIHNKYKDVLEIVEYPNQKSAMQALEEGRDIDLIFVVEQESQTTLQLIANEQALPLLPITQLAFNEVLDTFFEENTYIPDEYKRANFYNLETMITASNVLSFEDIIPSGIIAIAVMQTGIFGSVFSLMRFKYKGVLRQMQTTPAGPAPILIGLGISRILIVILQAYLLLLISIYIFDSLTFEQLGILQWINVALLAILGGFLFLGVGLLISARFNNENTAAVLSNIIVLPMMFLSGVFYTRSILPDWLETFANLLPLSFLVDAISAIVVNNANILDLWQPILGILAWAVVVFAFGIKFFRWE